MIKRFLLTLSLLVLAPLYACAQDEPKEFVEGEHYDVVSPAVRTADPNKIEVAEFFWYGCGHCYTFEPLVEQWKKGIADDVDFHGSPGVHRWRGPERSGNDFGRFGSGQRIPG